MLTDEDSVDQIYCEFAKTFGKMSRTINLMKEPHWTEDETAIMKESLRVFSERLVVVSDQIKFKTMNQIKATLRRRYNQQAAITQLAAQSQSIIKRESELQPMPVVNKEPIRQIQIPPSVPDTNPNVVGMMQEIQANPPPYEFAMNSVPPPAPSAGKDPFMHLPVTESNNLSLNSNTMQDSDSDESHLVSVPLNKFEGNAASPSLE